MRRRWIIWVGVLVALAGVIAGLALGLKPNAQTGPAAPRCYVDGAIPDGEETLVRAEAGTFIEQLLRGDPKAAYGQMSSIARAGASEAEFAALAGKVRESGPFGRTTANHALLVSAAAGAAAEASCPNEKGAATTVRRVGDAPLQAFVQGEVTAANGDRWFWDVSLSKDAGTWRVTRFDWTPNVD